MKVVMVMAMMAMVINDGSLQGHRSAVMCYNVRLWVMV